MADDEFFAEIVRLVVNGIQDGGADQITKFYKDTSDSTISLDKDIWLVNANSVLHIFDI
jgi:hypothetical protein